MQRIGLLAVGYTISSPVTTHKTYVMYDVGISGFYRSRLSKLAKLLAVFRLRAAVPAPNNCVNAACALAVRPVVMMQLPELSEGGGG